MANILVIRLSAIGDVAMTIPVIYSAARSNPNDHFTVLTQAFLMPLFMNRPSNVETVGINIKGEEKKLWGLLKFASALTKYDFDLVLDLHDVIRTRIIRSLFKLKGKKVYVVDKARKERKELVAETDKKLVQLRPVVERYADVFRSAGLKYENLFTSLYGENRPNISAVEEIFGEYRGNRKWIGVAPFAKHKGKIYPIEEMEKVVITLSRKDSYTIFLFGGGEYEKAVFEEWEYQYPNVKSVVGKLSLDKELALIANLDLLLSMDSANMHFASLVGTRVLSVWGATHPYAGFYGYGQNPMDSIQVDMPCRPCSVFGQKECARRDWACMAAITPEMIITKIDRALHE